MAVWRHPVQKTHPPRHLSGIDATLCCLPALVKQRKVDSITLAVSRRRHARTPIVGRRCRCANFGQLRIDKEYV